MDLESSYDDEKNKRPHPYKCDALHKAIAEIKSGTMNIMQAAKTFNVAHTSIRLKLKQDSNYNYAKRSRLIALSHDEETTLEKWLHWRSSIGCTVGWPELARTASSFLQKGGVSEDKQFTKGWLLRFKRRHPTVSVLKTKRECWYPAKDFSQKHMDEWFIGLYEYLIDQKVGNPFDFLNGSSVFSMVRFKGLVTNNHQSSIICCHNNVGASIKPHLLLSPDHPLGYMKSVVVNSELQVYEDPSACMDSCFQHVMHRAKEFGARPVLLLVDRKITNLSIAIMNDSLATNLSLYYFPLHSEQFQPLHVTFGERVKNSLMLLSSPIVDTSLKALDELVRYLRTESISVVRAFKECGFSPVSNKFKSLIASTSLKFSGLPAASVDMIKGMEYSLKLVQNCIDPSILPLYENFLREGKVPLNDGMFVAWRELKVNIHKEKDVLGICSVCKQEDETDTKETVMDVEIVCSDDISGVAGTSSSIRIEGSDKAFVPMNDRYRRDFKRDCMPPFNFESHALDILERYEASLATTPAKNLLQLEINEEDFCNQ